MPTMLPDTRGRGSQQEALLSLIMGAIERMKREISLSLILILLFVSTPPRLGYSQEAGVYQFSNPNFGCSYEEEEGGLFAYIVKVDSNTQEVLRYFYPASRFLRPRREAMLYFRSLFNQTGRAAYLRRSQSFATLVRQGNLCKQGRIHEDETVTPPNPSPSPSPSPDDSPCSVLGASTGGVSARIINGTSCTIGDSPIVRLSVGFGGDYYSCTGNVIAPRVILTAAHCIASGSDRATSVDVYTGSGVLSATGYAVHPLNETGAPGPFDLSILTLDEDLPTRVLSLVSSSSAFSDGETVYIGGYGRVGTGSAENSATDDLQASKMRLHEVSAQEIITLFDHSADGIEWGNTCNGDSGGPLVVERGSEWVLAGITSYGFSENCGPTDTSGFVNLQSAENRAFISTYAPGTAD